MRAPEIPGNMAALMTVSQVTILNSLKKCLILIWVILKGHSQYLLLGTVLASSVLVCRMALAGFIFNAT